MLSIIGLVQMALGAPPPSTALALPLSSPQALPGDDRIGQAAGTQDEPALVAGEGDAWLLVWRDTRAALAGTLGSDATDIYGIRVGSDGVPLDEVSFPIASGAWAESSPRAAWNGSDWLVAYEADAATASYWSQGVFARRVAAEGLLLDSSAILLADDDEQDESLWDVASDGESFAVLWREEAASAASYVLQGTTVDSDGVPAVSSTVYAPRSSVSAPVNARLAWADGSYLATWSAWGNDDDIEGLLLDAGLAADGAVFDIAGDANSSVSPAVAAGDGVFYVAWFDDTYGAYWCTVRGTPVTTGGDVEVSGGASLSGEAWPLDVHPTVAWSGGGWGVAWEYGAAAAIAVSLVDGAGELEAWSTITEEDGYTRTPTAAAGDGGVLVAWATYGGRSDFDLEVLAVDADGALGDIQDASLAAPAQTHPAIAGGEDGYLVVATSTTADEVAILAWRTDAGGEALDAEPIELARATSLAEPAVGWNGSVWLVTWTDTDASTSANGVVGVRVSADGGVLDSSPIALLTGTSSAVAASTDGDFLVAGVVPVTYNTNRLRAVRVSGDGEVLDGSPLDLGSNYAEAPDVAPFGTGWIVSWAHRHSATSGLRDAAYTVVSASGSVSTESLVRTSGSVARESGVNVASDGDLALVVWSDDGDLRGRFVDATGALMGDGAGFTISAESNSQFDPDLAWDGERYVVAWTDWRVHPTLEPGEGDVYRTWLSSTGEVATEAAVAVEDVPEGGAALAGADGRSVLVWTTLDNEAPFGAFRLRTAVQPDEGGGGDGGASDGGASDGGTGDGGTGDGGTGDGGTGDGGTGDGGTGDGGAGDGGTGDGGTGDGGADDGGAGEGEADEGKGCASAAGASGGLLFSLLFAFARIVRVRRD
ncbi:hypothetical protein L6R53_26370 [Myxococcota bacterium]|nr:hypothetical protein [Myxococcota bacterium]